MKFTTTTPTATIILLVITGLLYFVLGKIGLAFASLNPSASAIWPPTGFAIATLLIFGVRLWPAIFISAFFVNLTTAGTLATSLGIATGNTLEAVAATLLVLRFANGAKAFERPQHIILFALLAGIIAPLISATIGVATLSASGFISQNAIVDVWITWWLGDMGGAIIITPLILLWHEHPRVIIYPLRTLEFFSLLLFLFVIAIFIFTSRFPFPYLFILPLIWSAFRFELRETAAVIVLLAMIMIRGTLLGMGPFAQISANTNTALIQLQIFLAVIAITKLTVASVVAESKRSDEMLFARERRFKALIEKSSDAVCLIDPTARITYASPSTFAVLGFTPDEVMGRSGFSFIHPDDIAQAKHDLTRVLASPKDPVIGQYRMQRKDGSWVWIETVGRSLLLDPSVQSLVINFRDISERKELETAKDEFLMTAAHQLRAPLTSARWNLESLLGPKSTLTKETKTKLMRMFESNQEMVKTVNELMDIARIIQGKITDNPQRVDLIPLIKQQIHEATDYAKRKKVIITFNHSKPSEFIRIDPKHFSDVIANLLTNAIKYNTSGGSVTINSQASPTEVAIQLTDTGIGVPINEQTKLFTKFYRAPNAKHMDAEGTGLGLFIVKSYVEGWGGEVSLKSPISQHGGTKISIIIPIKKGGAS